MSKEENRHKESGFRERIHSEGKASEDGTEENLPRGEGIH